MIDGCRESAKGEILDPKVCLCHLYPSLGLQASELWKAEIDYFVKGPLLDFFGVPVKADEVLSRVEELQLLAKRISRYEDPISQFRALVYLKPATWSKGCGWNQSK